MKNLQIICASFAPFCMAFYLLNTGLQMSLAVLGLMVVIIFTKAGRDLFPLLDKLTPFAAVVFLMCTALNFNAPHMSFLHLFVLFVLGMRAFSVLAEISMFHENQPTYIISLLTCGGISYGVSTIDLPYFYPIAVCACLLCQVGTFKQSAQEMWKDIAYPAGVVLFSFGAIVGANQIHIYNTRLAEACLMVMIGGFIPACAKNPYRLTLMTAALYAISRYV